LKLIFAVDWLFLTAFERFAHWFQDWTGRNNFWWARQLFALCIVSMIMQNLDFFTSKQTSLLTKILLGGTLLCASAYLSTIMFNWVVNTMERLSHILLMDGLANSMKNDPVLVVIRVALDAFICLMFTLGAYKNLGTFVILELGSMWMAANFLACDAKPPAPNKFKMLLRGFFRKPATTSVHFVANSIRPDEQSSRTVYFIYKLPSQKLIFRRGIILN
jgi:hypothetical protein